MKKILGTLAATLIAVPLGAVLLPLFYMMAWLLVLVLPVAIICAVIQEAKGNGTLGLRKEFVGNILFALLVVPLAIMAFAAPLRVLLLAPLSFFPEQIAKFNEMHGFIYEPFIPLFGDLFPYWFDMYWGVLSLLTMFLIALCDSIRRNRLTRQVEVLPTSRIRSVAVGLAELKGKAVPLDGRSRNDPIMRSWIESIDDGMTARPSIERFYLDDGSGRILVDATGVSIQSERNFFGINLHQAILKPFAMKTGLPAERLMPGDSVVLIGNVQINRDRAGFQKDEVVVKPRKSTWHSMEFYDLFFISNISEEALLGGLRKSVKRGWRNVLLGMAFGGWLAAFALTNIMQLESSRIDAAPDYLRLVSAPTTLEREISVGELGEHPTLYFVDMLKEGDHKKTEAIMRQFRALRLESLALPILKEQAMNIDDSGFGIANHWLTRLGRSLPRQSGFEFFSSHYINDSEAVVLRLSTKYFDNRLFVSYRTHVGKNRKIDGDYIRSRKVVIDLTDKKSGEKYTASFDAAFGANNADDVEASEYLSPGAYELDVYLATNYRSGLYSDGSRRKSPTDILLEE
ncbi:MAG: hypothetical protein E4H01_00625 [Lysobacterales bacterium]|nr:MAG: hypothetical protein E4H01_00625 [Xanthomonadales bacterium]